ncbi:MAG: UDP-N-acetylglucosamine 2-epimerase (hydrolyzing) [Candidatus Sericytochromatia bacterium]|nr:UDP-N-acetylglucosamine 2-epimerase (hydrolyzing) [Candidatus Sericytochromatia bacterium]
MRLAILTSGRQDWGILRSTCQRLKADPAFELIVLAGGMHASAAFGRTVTQLDDDGCTPDAVLEWLADPDAPAWHAAGLALHAVGDALARFRPDALLLAGDRYETLAAAQAATLLTIPIVHLHGGEETAGAIDNALRHAISKLSHLHLVSHADHAARLIAMGEDPATIHVVGAPGLDNLHRPDLPDRAALEARLGLTLNPPVVLVTVHPTTLSADPAADAFAVAAAMGAWPATYVITLPNADPGHAAVRTVMQTAGEGPRRVAVDALGEQFFWGMMQQADIILGNSSSALIEAPAGHLPAVTAGARQAARLRDAHVVDVPADPAAIVAALAQAMDPTWRAGLQALPGLFGDGHAAARIQAILTAWVIPHPPLKRWPTPPVG